MKLHLPKLLLTAVLAACVVAPTWGEEVQLNNQQLTWSTDITDYEGDIVRLTHGTNITMTSGNVTMLKLRIHDFNNTDPSTKESFTLQGGTLNITDSDSGDGTGVKAITIGHWGNASGTSELNIAGGTLNVLNGSIRVGYDSPAAMNISAGEANVKGIEFSSQNKNAILNMTGGRLNIGAGGIVNNGSVNGNRTVTLAGGTIGALDANGWTLSGITTKVGNIAVDTNVVNATVATGAKISLLGELGKTSADATQSITVSGSGSLLIDHTFDGDITKAENATAKLEIKALSDFKYDNSSFSGYKDSTTSGYRTSDYTIVKGTTDYDTVWYGGKEYAMEDGVLTMTDSTVFVLDGVSFEYTADSTDSAATAPAYKVLNGGLLKLSAGLPSTFTGGVTLEDKGSLEIATGSPNITGGIHIVDGTATIGLTGSGVRLNTSSVSMSSGTRVDYVVDGAILDINQENLGTAIKSITMSNGGTAELSHAFMSLGSEQNKVAITMSGNSALKLYNGNSWAQRTLWADILVDGAGIIAGSSNGNSSYVMGSISGNGVLTFNKVNNTNLMNIHSTISDGDNEGDTLAITVDLTNGDNHGNARIDNANNTYSGGTTLQSGYLTVNGAKALGSGTLTINGGKLILASDLTVGALTNNTSGPQNLDGHTMTVTGKATGSRIEVQNGTLIINDNLELTGNLALHNYEKTTGEGESAVTELIGAEIQLYGKGNTVNVLDLSNSNNSKGKVVLKEASATTIKNGVDASGGALWMNSSSYIELEKDSSLSWGKAKVIGISSETKGQISTTENENVYLGSTKATMSNVQLTVTEEGQTDVKVNLQNVELINDGAGTLTLTNSNNTLTALHALKGSVSVTGQDEIILNALTVYKNMTVTAGKVTVGSPMATYSTESTGNSAVFQGGAKVAGILDLTNATTLTLSGIAAGSLVTVTGELALPATGSLTLDGDILSQIAALADGATLDVFNVGSFTLGGSAVEALTAADNYTLDYVFSNTDLGSDYYLGYTAPVDGGLGTVYIGKVVPEPTTATLSLLALAGLAARRRRK